MNKKPPRNRSQATGTLPRALAADLRGRQSVRVAFKLTPNTIEAIHILGAHLRLKPKSLFDHMVQERRTLEAIAAKADLPAAGEDPPVAKTYVISRDAAEILDAVSNARQIPRDALVEASVQHLMPLIEKEQVRHGARKSLLAKMERHLKGGRRLLEAMTADLGPNDPMSDKMQHVMGVYERAYATMADYIRKGEKIEAFDTEN